jgi:hypothetical protein
MPTTSDNSLGSSKPSSPLPQGARRQLSEDQLRLVGELRHQEGWVVYRRYLVDLKEQATSNLRKASDLQTMYRAQGELDMVEHILGLFASPPSQPARRPKGGIY